MNVATLAVIVLMIAFGLAFGQQPADLPTPSITGFVVDASGAVIPGAKVSLFRSADNVPIAVAKTDGKGEFQFLLREDREFKLVAEATCFKPTSVEGIAAKREGSTQLPPIILQVQRCSEGAVEPPPATPDPSELSKSLEVPKQTTIVSVCELLENIKQYSNPDVAVIGRMDRPGDKLIDHYEYVAQDHCELPIVTKGYVWPSKAVIWSRTEAAFPRPPNDEPERSFRLSAKLPSSVFTRNHGLAKRVAFTSPMFEMSGSSLMDGSSGRPI